MLQVVFSLLNFKIHSLHQLIVDVQIDLILADGPAICGAIQAEVVGVVAAGDIS